MRYKHFLQITTSGIFALGLAFTCSVNAADKAAVIPLGDDFFIIPIKSKICAPYTFSQPGDYTEFVHGSGVSNEGNLLALASPPFAFQGSSTLVSASITASIQTPSSDPTINFYMTQVPGSFSPSEIVTNSTTTVNSGGFGELRVYHVTEGTLAYTDASDQVSIALTLSMTNRCPDNTLLTIEDNFVVTITLEPS